MSIQNIQLWLNRHYKTIRFFISVTLATGVLLLLFLAYKELKAQNESIKNQTQTIEDQTNAIVQSTNRLIRYEECLAKIYIAPPQREKVIKGDIDDPAEALERCRIEVDGVLGPSSSTTRQSQSRPTTPQSETQPPQEKDPSSPNNPSDGPKEPEPTLEEQIIDRVDQTIDTVCGRVEIC